VNEAADEAACDRRVPVVVLGCWLAGAALSRRVGMWLGIGGVALLLAAALLARDARRLAPLARPATKPIALGLLAGVAMTVLTYVLHGPLVDGLPAIGREVSGLYERLGATRTAWRAVALLPVVAAEELVWRGAVQSALARRAGVWPGVLAAAALYAVGHAPVGSLLLVTLAFGCGLVWSGVRAATASLLAPFVAHAVWDEIVLFVFPLR
jgi:membrane protease YdiL (CAAX protease family)